MMMFRRKLSLELAHTNSFGLLWPLLQNTSLCYVLPSQLHFFMLKTVELQHAQFHQMLNT